LDVPLGLVTVADVAYPQSADPDQPLNIIPQWFFEVPQIQGKSHPQAFRQSEIIHSNGTPQGLDPGSQELEPLSKAV
jgi:hypothetical protein